jgi:CBS domain containing-hemolysin-like protein
MIPPLKVTDEVTKARLWMDELKLSELPVTDQGSFLGLLSEENIFENQELNIVGDFKLEATTCFIQEDQHYYDVLKKAYSNGVRLIAVVNVEGTYIGVVSIEDVVEAFANSSSVNTPGAILVLSMEYRDYSLSEISRIIEMDDAKILSSHLLSDTKEYGKVRVTLKINKEDITHIIAILEANGYRVAEYFSENSEGNQTQERYDILMNYLKI